MYQYHLILKLLQCCVVIIFIFIYRLCANINVGCNAHFKEWLMKLKMTNPLMLPGQPKMSESSRGKWRLKWRNPNSRNSKKLSKWQTTSIDVCLMHLHICIPVLCSSITLLLWDSVEGTHWGAATQCVIQDLRNGFTEITSLTWRWMCNPRVSNRSEISWPCIISVTAEMFFYCWEDEIADIWYTQTWWRFYTLLDSKYSVAARADSYLYCFSLTSEHPLKPQMAIKCMFK